RWSATEAQARVAKEALDAAIAAVETATQQAASASTIQAEAAALLPPLRQTETEKSAALHRLVVERDALDAEETRARETAQRLRNGIAQGEQEAGRDRALDADAKASLHALTEEAARLNDDTQNARASIEAAEASASEIAAHLAETERTLDRLSAELAEWHA